MTDLFSRYANRNRSSNGSVIELKTGEPSISTRDCRIFGNRNDSWLFEAMGDFTLANSPDTLSPCHPFARHPISLSLYCQDILSACHPIPPDTLLLGHPISLTPYLTLILFHSPYLTLTLSHSPYLTHTLSHSHPICESPYRPCAQEVTEGMLELERSRIETATELEQIHDQKDNLQEHLSVLKQTLVVVTLSHACTCRHASSRFVTLVFLSFS